MITTLVLFIVFGLMMESMIGGIIASLVLSGIVLSSQMELKMPQKKEITIHKEEIYSLSNGDSNIKGSFFLGSGNINSTPQYSYFIHKENGAKVKKFIKSTKTEIFETNDRKPEIEIETCVDGQELSKMSLMYKVIDKCDFKEKRRIYVPKETVILEFSI